MYEMIFVSLERRKEKYIQSKDVKTYKGKITIARECQKGFEPFQGVSDGF